MAEIPHHWSPDQEPDNLYKAKRDRTYNGKKYVWDEKTSDYVRWITVRGVSFCISMRKDREEDWEKAAMELGNEVEFRKSLDRIEQNRRTNGKMSRKEIIEQMKLLECDLYSYLALVDRTLLKYDTTGRKKLEFTGQLPLKAEGNSYIERKASNGNVIQCRFYDADGNAEQDFDFHHADGNGSHLFPHTHVFIRGRRSKPLPLIYKDGRILYRKQEIIMADGDVLDEVLWPQALAGKLSDRTIEAFSGYFWLKLNNITYDSIRDFETPPFKSTGMTIRDIQCLLAYGREFYIEYGECKAFLGMSFSGSYIIESWYQGKNTIYETGSLNRIPDEAYIGPFMLRDVIDKCVLTQI